MATPVSTRLIVPAAFWVGLTAALLVLWLSGQGARAWEVVREARWAVLPLVVLLGIALPVIHAIRWRIVMRTLGTDISPLMAADMTVSASLVNYASPGYLGAPAMAFMANRTAGAPWSRSLLSLAFEQGLDFLVLVVGSLIALAILGPDRISEIVPELGRTAQLTLGVLLVVGIVVFLLLGRDRIERGAKRIVEAFRALGGRVDWRIIGVLTLAKWLAQAAVVGLLLWALRLPTDPTALLALSTIPLMIGQLVPLPGGVGAREAAIVALSGATGATAAGLLGLAVLQRVLLIASLPLSLGLLRLARASGLGGQP
jgi:uncharacterized membrane protein YbhN (UPF0104 family)